MSVKMLMLRDDGLRTARVGKGLSQTALAAKSGVARATINRIERGHAESVTFDTINRIAKALKVDADLLVSFK
jgi:transcriptional regulator with XRE-family HTH domain